MEETRTPIGDMPPEVDPAREPAAGVKDQVAERLESAAEVLHEQAQRYEGRLGDYSRQAAQWLDRSADYLRELDTGELRNDLQNRVRRNPGRALLVAGAAGLVVGVLLRRL